MTAPHRAGFSNVSDQPEARPHRGRSAEVLIGGAIVLALVVIGIVAQQTIFYNFVHETGGVPRGLFERAEGSHYKLWSFTLPLWVMTMSIAGVGSWWTVRLIKLGSPWYVIAAWIVYVAVMWSLVGASSGLVEVLEAGEGFI